MNFVLERLTDPEVEPVTLAEMKVQVRAYDEVTDEDAFLTSLISVAREYIEDYTARALIDQTWRLSVVAPTDPRVTTPDGSCQVGTNAYSAKGEIYLRRSPVIEVTAVSLVDAAGAETVIDSTQYQLRDAGSKYPRVYLLNGGGWSGDVRIEFRAGFANRAVSPQEGGEKVPPTIIQALKLMASHFYENRVPVNIGNIVNQLPLGVEALLRNQVCDVGFA